MKSKCGNCKSVLQINIPPDSSKQYLFFKCPKCDSKNRLINPEFKQEIERISSSNPNKKDVNTIGWLVLHTENIPPITYTIFEGKNIIGRPTKDNSVDVSIKNDGYLSRKHAILNIEFKHGKWQYIFSDNNSTNGTFHNTEKVEKGEELYLEEGDTIQVGRTKLVLKLKSKNATIDDAEKTVISSDFEKTIIM
jgi:pSer/pThr/pTyr-binding forkhead associated (FHA) protein